MPMALEPLPPLSLRQLTAIERQLADELTECANANVRLRRHVRPSPSAAAPAAPAGRTRIYQRLHQIRERVASLKGELNVLLSAPADTGYGEGTGTLRGEAAGEPKAKAGRAVNVAVEMHSAIKNVTASTDRRDAPDAPETKQQL